jgi:prepilin-type N-terminal cleavage/methylation domain-containing protein
MQPTKPLRPNGFTLLELLVALTILAMMMVVIMSGLALGSRVWNQGTERIQVAQRLRIITDLIGSQIASARPYYIQDRELKKRILQFCVKPDRLDMVTTAESMTVFNEQISLGLREISFFVREDTGDPGVASGLVMREASIAGEYSFDEDRGFLIQLDPMVTKAHFEWAAVYNDEDDMLYRVNDIDWCWPEDREVAQGYTFAGLNDQQTAEINKMLGEKLPMAIIVTLTMKIPRKGDFVEIELPPQTIPLWNSREFTYPKQKTQPARR